ncbi:Magnesium transporter NIPA [Phaffia rhodozyma]|uniref:Magnesium transporter NIPA n=1 Tax=Phaffia rhodozyma TaxID=264483 RepID=A0A0F7SQA2_PHARH|nr:Magnesium transporter NIPA [Phaffia rhodozyma]
MNTSVSPSSLSTPTMTLSSLATTIVLSRTLTASPSATSTVSNDRLDVLPGNPLANFILGLLVITLASVMNSFGLNMMKLDHIKTALIPSGQKRPEWLRPTWLLGFGSYVISQLVGSTLALRYLRAEFVAPLGSSSLVFNFLFARWLVGTRVILILVFASINSGLSNTLSLDRLYVLWGRGGFLFYFFLQILVLFSAWETVHMLALILRNQTSNEDEIEQHLSTGPHKHIPKFFHPVQAYHKSAQRFLSVKLSVLLGRSSEKHLAFCTGIGWASVGGAMAGASLVFAKATVMIGMGEGNVYIHFLPMIMIAFLALSAVLQMIALNRGLKAYDSTLVVPVFYAGYTLLGFVNSMVFLDQVGAYSWTVLFCIAVGVTVLLSGVVLLSSIKKEPVLETPSADVQEDHERHLNAIEHPDHGRTRTESHGIEERRALFDAEEDAEEEDSDDRFKRQSTQKREDELASGAKWEVGSVSDDEEEEGSKWEGQLMDHFCYISDTR